MIGKKLQNPAPKSGQKRAAAMSFLRHLFVPIPKSSTPDSSLQRCSACFFPTEFHKVPLLASNDYNSDTKILSFGLPESVSLNLPVSSCLLVQGFDSEGNEAIRPYTPISSDRVTGSFDLLCKIYEKGVVSQWLGNLKIGSQVAFKQLPENLKVQYPFQGRHNKTITKLNLICCSTGIAPMYQILQKIVDDDSELEAVLLCGNRGLQDILLQKEIDDLTAKATRWDDTSFFTRKQGVVKAASRFTVVHVLGDRVDESWPGEVGWVDELRVSKYCYPPAPDVLTFVCGVPGLYDSLCGPRSHPELLSGSVLAKLGYSADSVCKL